MSASGRRWVGLVTLPWLVLLLSGCAAEVSTSAATPACSVGDGDDDTAANGVVLMAQSVPTAAWVPCVAAIPVGWTFTGLDARRGTARFYLDSDRDGVRAIEVRLSSTCDTTGATATPSDREGMRRLERVTQVSPQYVGERYYVFDGGCITFAFALQGESRGEPIHLATQAVGVVSRDDLRAQVLEESDGRLSLDPATGDR